MRRAFVSAHHVRRALSIATFRLTAKRRSTQSTSPAARSRNLGLSSIMAKMKLCLTADSHPGCAAETTYISVVTGVQCRDGQKYRSQGESNPRLRKTSFRIRHHNR